MSSQFLCCISTGLLLSLSACTAGPGPTWRQTNVVPQSYNRPVDSRPYNPPAQVTPGDDYFPEAPQETRRAAPPREEQGSLSEDDPGRLKLPNRVRSIYDRNRPHSETAKPGVLPGNGPVASNSSQNMKPVFVGYDSTPRVRLLNPEAESNNQVQANRPLSLGEL